MPKTPDKDPSKDADNNIIFNMNVDCPECDAIVPDVQFDTEAKDEDGLADLTAGELTSPVTCPECGHQWDAQYEGWMTYGEAG